MGCDLRVAAEKNRSLLNFYYLKMFIVRGPYGPTCVCISVASMGSAMVGGRAGREGERERAC